MNESIDVGRYYAPGKTFLAKVNIEKHNYSRRYTILWQHNTHRRMCSTFIFDINNILHSMSGHRCLMRDGWHIRRCQGRSYLAVNSEAQRGRSLHFRGGWI